MRPLLAVCISCKLRRQIQAHDERIVIRSAIRIGRVIGVLDAIINVESGFVGVDMPFAKTGDLRIQMRRCKRVIERAEQTIVGKRITIRRGQTQVEMRKSGVAQDLQWRFLRVGVEIANLYKRRGRCCLFSIRR